MKKIRIIMSGVVFLITAGGLAPLCAEEPMINITETSLEELMNIDVTTFGKKPEKLQQTPAAMTVITSEDIRRSGANNLPDLLRTVPGVDVAQINANQWAISIRGFNGRASNKMLVMVDGRVIFDPLFYFTFWEDQNLPLENIERIEVIRGPGGALWGANAVNGIISIITKHAKDTQGGLVVAGGGTEERAFTRARYGDQIGEDAYLRVYGHAFQRDAGFAAAPIDDWQAEQLGFRLDWAASPSDALMFRSDVQYNIIKESVGVTTRNNEHAWGDVLARWTRTLDAQSDFSLQFFYTRTKFESASLGELRDILDFDFQHHVLWLGNQDLVWGVGFHWTGDNITTNPAVLYFVPAQRQDPIYSAFIQNECFLMGDQLKLTVGSKFEQNTYSGFEFQPGARLAWFPDARHTVWASVSRAVVTPARLITDLRITAMPAFVTVNLQSEVVIAYELGFRAQPDNLLSIDLATFVNRYDHLLTGESTGFFNNMDGFTYGGELSAQYQALPSWHLIGAYTFLLMELEARPGSPATVLAARNTSNNSSPKHQASLQSRVNLTSDVEWDTTLRYVDALTALNVSAYTTVDVRLAWQATSTLNVAVIGQNLLQDHHMEFRATGSTEVERGVYGKVTWKF